MVTRCKKKGLKDYQLKKEAIKFFGVYAGSEKTLIAWKTKFEKSEYVKKKK